MNLPKINTYLNGLNRALAEENVGLLGKIDSETRQMQDLRLACEEAEKEAQQLKQAWEDALNLARAREEDLQQ